MSAGGFVRVYVFNPGTGAVGAGSQLEAERHSVTRTLISIFREDDGQDLVEYALIAALVSVISVLAIDSVGAAIKQHYVTSTTTFAGS